MGERAIDEAAERDVFILIISHWTCCDKLERVITFSCHLLCMRMKGGHTNRQLLPKHFLWRWKSTRANNGGVVFVVSSFSVLLESHQEEADGHQCANWMLISVSLNMTQTLKRIKATSISIYLSYFAVLVHSLCSNVSVFSKKETIIIKKRPMNPLCPKLSGEHSTALMEPSEVGRDQKQSKKSFNLPASRL